MQYLLELVELLATPHASAAEVFNRADDLLMQVTQDLEALREVHLGEDGPYAPDAAAIEAMIAFCDRRLAPPAAALRADAAALRNEAAFLGDLRRLSALDRNLVFIAAFHGNVAGLAQVSGLAADHFVRLVTDLLVYIGRGDRAANREAVRDCLPLFIWNYISDYGAAPGDRLRAIWRNCLPSYQDFWAGQAANVRQEINQAVGPVAAPPPQASVPSPEAPSLGGDAAWADMELALAAAMHNVNLAEYATASDGAFGGTVEWISECFRNAAIHSRREMVRGSLPRGLWQVLSRNNEVPGETLSQIWWNSLPRRRELWAERLPREAARALLAATGGTEARNAAAGRNAARPATPPPAAVEGPNAAFAAAMQEHADAVGSVRPIFSPGFTYFPANALPVRVDISMGGGVLGPIDLAAPDPPPAVPRDAGLQAAITAGRAAYLPAAVRYFVDLPPMQQAVTFELALSPPSPAADELKRVAGVTGKDLAAALQIAALPFDIAHVAALTATSYPRDKTPGTHVFQQDLATRKRSLAASLHEWTVLRLHVLGVTTREEYLDLGGFPELAIHFAAPLPPPSPYKGLQVQYPLDDITIE